MHLFATVTPEQLLEGGKKAYFEATAEKQSAPSTPVTADR
jgi:hypothetical protein